MLNGVLCMKVTYINKKIVSQLLIDDCFCYYVISFFVRDYKSLFGVYEAKGRESTVQIAVPDTIITNSMTWTTINK